MELTDLNAIISPIYGECSFYASHSKGFIPIRLTVGADIYRTCYWILDDTDYYR